MLLLLLLLLLYCSWSPPSLAVGSVASLIWDMSWSAKPLGIDDVLKMMGLCQGPRPTGCKAQAQVRVEAAVGEGQENYREDRAPVSWRTEGYASPSKTHKCREGAQESAEGWDRADFDEPGRRLDTVFVQEAQRG